MAACVSGEGGRGQAVLVPVNARFAPHIACCARYERMLVRPAQTSHLATPPPSPHCMACRSLPRTQLLAAASDRSTRCAYHLYLAPRELLVPGSLGGTPAAGPANAAAGQWAEAAPMASDEQVRGRQLSIPLGWGALLWALCCARSASWRGAVYAPRCMHAPISDCIVGMLHAF